MAASNPIKAPKLCGCPTCDSPTAHRPSRCRRKPQWYISYHAVDRCKEFEPFQAELCQQCFEAYIDLAKRTIGWGMEGVRSPLCQGCYGPMTRLSSIIKDVGHA